MALMAEFSAADIQKLRQMAGVGMMDAKKALTETAGDLDRAFQLLREKGLAAAKKRAERDANQGAIGSYLHHQAERPVIGVIVELASETDFVAKSPEFLDTATDVAMHVSWANPRWIQREDVPPDAIAKERAILQKRAEAEGKPPHLVAKIVEGRLATFYADNVLYEQPFVNSEKFNGTVGTMVQQLAAKMGENISVRRIARLAVGEQVE